MEQKKWFAISVFFLIFLFGGIKTFLTFNERSPDATPSKTPSGREFEDSKIKSKQSKTKSESKVIFNDPNMFEAWALKKADANKAWTLSKGNRDIVVAVIDTGIEENHEDLKRNLWVNKREIPGNGIDDDQNGFIDDVHGWNFVGQNNDLSDHHGHGTHIAGIIGAEAGNGKGVVGICPEVSIMVLKYFDPTRPSDVLHNTIEAIKYAVANGANIINYSGGGTEFSNDEMMAIKEAEKKGILFVAAAGNERSNSDYKKYYPADYGLSNIISVTAIDPLTQVLSSSNYGTQTVDIAAPGQNIISTLPGNNYGLMTGTSQATAFVSGGACLVMAHKDFKDAEDVKKYILNTGNVDTGLLLKTRTARQLNLYKSLTMLDTNMTATGVKESTTEKPSNAPSSGGNIPKGFGRSLLDALKKKEK